MLSPTLVAERRHAAARAVRRTLAEYEDPKDLIAMLGLVSGFEASREPE